MKAPDKIYLHGYPLYEEPCAEWAEVPFYGQFRGQQAETVEYIRKDALIEWLENKIKISDGGFVNGLICLAYKDVIEHLNEM